MKLTKLESNTRKVFHKIHTEHLNEKDSLNRIRNLLTIDNMKLEEGFFKKKICADLGCGSAISGTINLLELGAEKVYAMDLDESILQPATKVLKSKNFTKSVVS